MRRRGWYSWTSSSSSSFSIRDFRAYPLIETRRAVPRRAIRGSSISVNSTLLPSQEKGAWIWEREGTIGVSPAGGASTWTFRGWRRGSPGWGYHFLYTRMMLYYYTMQSLLYIILICFHLFVRFLLLSGYYSLYYSEAYSVGISISIIQYYCHYYYYYYYQ